MLTGSDNSRISFTSEEVSFLSDAHGFGIGGQGGFTEQSCFSVGRRSLPILFLST